MSEYITELVSRDIEDPFVREKIVRCKNCIYLDDSEVRRWDEFLAECYGSPPLFCSLLSLKEKEGVDGNLRRFAIPLEVKPDDFCCWGKIYLREDM